MGLPCSGLPALHRRDTERYRWTSRRLRGRRTSPSAMCAVRHPDQLVCVSHVELFLYRCGCFGYYHYCEISPAQLAHAHYFMHFECSVPLNPAHLSLFGTTPAHSQLLLERLRVYSLCLYTSTWTSVGRQCQAKFSWIFFFVRGRRGENPKRLLSFVVPVSSSVLARSLARSLCLPSSPHAEARFTWLNHRHKCRKCMEAVCNSCSKGRKVSYSSSIGGYWCLALFLLFTECCASCCRRCTTHTGHTYPRLSLIWRGVCAAKFHYRR